MSTLTLVGCTSGDWEGAFVDGILVDEGHSVDLIPIINGNRVIPPATRVEVESDWLEGIGGTFPPSIDHIPYEAYTK